MKELSIEEKAKRYDEAIDMAKNTLELAKVSVDVKECLESIFPELKESEDERIRKALTNGFNKLDKSAVWYNGITNGQILDWLEKKGKNKSIDDLTSQEAMDIAVAKCFDEQKPDKVKPKFPTGNIKLKAKKGE